MGDYRDDREAALQRAERLSLENERLQAELATRGERVTSRATTRAPRVLAALLGAGVAAGAVVALFAAAQRPAATVDRPSLELRGRWSSPSSLAHVALRGAARAGDGTWVVGDHGTILYRPESSGQWSVVPSGTDADLYAITAGVWLVAVGAHGTALRFDTAARRWVPERSGATDDLYAVMSDGGVVVAVGAHGTVVECSSSGHWSSHPNDSAADLYGIALADRGVVAVGANGTIINLAFSAWRGVPDGAQWEIAATRQASPTRANLRAVAVWNHNLLAVGDGGAMVSATEFSPWTLVASPSTEDLFTVATTEIAYEEHSAGFSSSGSLYGFLAAGAHGNVFVDRLGSRQGWRSVHAGGGAVRAMTLEPWNFFADDGASFSFAVR